MISLAPALQEQQTNAQNLFMIQLPKKMLRSALEIIKANLKRQS